MNAQRPSPVRTTVAACGVALLLAMHHAAAQETLVFSAAGLDCPSHTNGRSPVLCSGFPADAYDICAKRITLTTATRLTRLQAILSSAGTGDYSKVVSRLSIYQDHSQMSAEQAFLANPFDGNVFSTQDMYFIGYPAYWGPGGWGGYTNYRTTLQFSAPVLSADSYLVAFYFPHENSIGWSESDINLGSAVETATSPIYGLFSLHSDFPEDYPTGTPAWDLYGITCPADFNNDGLVEDADFVIFAQAYDALLCP